MKAGAGKILLDNFSREVNNLTDSVNSKNNNGTMMAANKAYMYLPEFLSFYKEEVSPDVKRLKYYTRNSMLNGMAGSWEQADSEVNELKSTWSILKTVLPKDNQEDVNKLELAIYEYEKVIREKNLLIVDIKGRIVLTDIEELEKAIEKASEKTSGKSEEK